MIFSIYASIMGLTGISSYLLGLFVLFQGPRKVLYRAWCYFCFAVGTWCLGYYFTMLPGISKDLALLCSRFSHASGALIPIFLLRYVLIWTDANYKPRFLPKLCYVTCGIIGFLSLTPAIVTDLVPKLNFPYYPVGKIGYAVYVLSFVGWILYAHCHMFKNMKYFSSVKRNQFIYLLIGIILGYFGGATCFPLIFGIKILPYPSVLVLIYIVTTTYAILTYRLMNIEVIIARSFILACVYAPIILISLGLKLWAKDFLYVIFGDKWLLVPLGTFGALSFAGSFAYLFFQQKYDQKRFRQQNAQLSHLKEATRTAIEVHWENLLKNIPAFVTQLYRQEFNTDIEYAAVYFYDKKRAEYILFSYKAKKVDTAYLPKSILKTDPMPDWFGRAIASQTNIKNPALSESIKYEELEYLKDHLTDLNLIDSLEKLKRSMEKLRADVCTYCFYQDRLLAFMLLGKRQKGSYSEGEINTFSLLSHDISMAIRSGEQQDEVVKSHLDALVAVGTALEEKDAYTKGHSERVARYGQAIAIELVDVFPYTRIYDLPEKTHLAGLLHDIGKIGVIDSILLKPGKLTEEEFKSLQKHPLASLHIIQSLGSISEEVRDGIESHHEKYDGTGYGKGAKGHRIPPIARIIAVVDAYDAMTSDRPYRKAMSEEVAKEEINRVSGTQFDPKAVEAFNKAYAKGKLKRDIS